MRLLIFGAAVPGSLYAVKLLAASHDVTVPARGRRAAQLRADGLAAQAYGRNCLRVPVSAVDSLNPQSSCAHVLLLVRNDQGESVLPSLTANKTLPSPVFLFNHLGGPQRPIDALGHDRGVLELSRSG